MYKKIDPTGKKQNITAIKKRLISSFIIAVLCAVVLMFLSNTALFEIIELKSFDYRMISRPYNQNHAANKNIVIIALDDETFQKINDPVLFWVTYYSLITNTLFENGAKVLGFDIIQMRSVDSFFKSFFAAYAGKSAPPKWDFEFAQTIKGKNVILASRIDDITKAWITPLDQFTLALENEDIAPANTDMDEDKIARRQPVYLKDTSGNDHICFGFAALSKYLGGKIEFAPVKNPSTSNKPVITGRDDKRGGIFSIGNNPIITGRDYNMLINYAGPAGTFTTIPLWKVIRMAQKGDNKFFEREFKDKIVLIGATDPASQDLKNTPYGIMPGVEIHANVINTVLQKKYLKKINPAANYAILIIMCVLVAGLCFSLPTLRASVYTACMLTIFAAINFICFNKNIIINLTLPIAGALFTYAAAYTYKYVTEDKEKNKLRKLFMRYASAPVVNTILAHPENLALGGEYTEVSVLFSDINGFTTLSEKLSPKEIITLLNEYFDLMIEVIFKNRGLLKQFVGDEIMAIYGAPYQQPDHAVLAARTAVEMMQELEKWKKRQAELGKPSFDIKIGLHTGMVVCGNVGSSKRTEYAAVGDVVNTGSRIMGLNSKIKTSTRILASKEFYEKVQNEVSANYIGKFPVKGKNAELDIYEIIGIK